MVQQGNVSLCDVQFCVGLFLQIQLIPYNLQRFFAKTLDSLICLKSFESVSDLVAPPPPPPGQGGQQVVTQILRGQAASPAAGAPRLQGQGQVKLTVAQLGQLTQVSQSLVTHESLGPTLCGLFHSDRCIIYCIYMSNIKICTRGIESHPCRQYNIVILEKSSRTQDTKKSIARLFTMYLRQQESYIHICTYTHTVYTHFLPGLPVR